MIQGHIHGRTQEFLIEFRTLNGNLINHEHLHLVSCSLACVGTYLSCNGMVTDIKIEDKGILCLCDNSLPMSSSRTFFAS